MPAPLPAERQREVAKLTSELFHCWSLLCIDSILQMFTLSYGSRRVASGVTRGLSEGGKSLAEGAHWGATSQNSKKR